MSTRLHRSTIFLITLWIIDVVLITLHFFHRLAIRGIIHSDFLINSIFSMSEEGQLPDLFQYVKELAIVAILVFIALQGKRMYAIWAAIFGYILLDDIAEIHERIGYIFEDKMPQIASMDPAEVAQTGFLVLVSGILFGVALLMIWRNRDKQRQACLHLTILLAIAAFFGVGVDMLQGLIMNRFGISGIVKIVEDGGEMLIISVILWYTYRIAFESIPNINFARLIPVRLKARYVRPLSSTLD
ncbi:MAG: hypothetical protein WAS33_23065 [Candidatus Promineifilaceae bacterium]